ncbi:MAG: hypothetical protein BGP15_20825 [Sphingobacterium sp. 40-24]|nr:MAG: hypothetical protein BGP15_20825 [Sphingobacterium sp. 40-24]
MLRLIPLLSWQWSADLIDLGYKCAQLESAGFHIAYKSFQSLLIIAMLAYIDLYRIFFRFFGGVAVG